MANVQETVVSLSQAGQNLSPLDPPAASNAIERLCEEIVKPGTKLKLSKEIYRLLNASSDVNKSFSKILGLLMGMRVYAVTAQDGPSDFNAKLNRLIDQWDGYREVCTSTLPLWRMFKNSWTYSYKRVVEAFVNTRRKNTGYAWILTSC